MFPGRATRGRSLSPGDDMPIIVEKGGLTVGPAAELEELHLRFKTIDGSTVERATEAKREWGL